MMSLCCELLLGLLGFEIRACKIEQNELLIHSHSEGVTMWVVARGNVFISKNNRGTIHRQ